MDQEQNIQVRAATKILLGLALTGFALWLSPYTLGELMSVIGIPLAIVLAIGYGLTTSGQGARELMSFTEFGERIQKQLREARSKMEQKVEETKETVKRKAQEVQKPRSEGTIEQVLQKKADEAAERTRQELHAKVMEALVGKEPVDAEPQKPRPRKVRKSKEQPGA